MIAEKATAGTARRRRVPLWLVTASLSAGAAAAILTSPLGGWPYAPSAGWDATAIVFCALKWREIWPPSAEQTAARATREDPSRATRDAIVLTACVASRGRQSRRGPGRRGVAP